MSKRATQNETESVYGAVLRRIGWLLLAGAWVFLVVSLISFSPYDPPSHAAAPLNERPANWCGWVGAQVAYEAYTMFGLGAWVIVGAVLAYLIARATGNRIYDLALRVIGALLMATAVAGFMALLAPASGPMPEGSGGLLGITVAQQLAARFNTIGSALVLVMVFAVGSVLAVDWLVLRVPRGLVIAFQGLVDACRWIASLNWPRPAAVGGALKSLAAALPRPNAGNREQSGKRQGGRSIPLRTGPDAEEDKQEKPGRKGKKRKKGKADEDAEAEAAEEVSAEAADEEAAWAEDPDAAAAEEASDAAADETGEEAGGARKKKRRKKKAKKAAAAVESEEEAADEPEAEEGAYDADAVRDKIKQLPISFASQKKPAERSEPQQQDLSGYQFPGYDTLAEPESNFSEEMAKLVREQAEVLETALQTFRVQAEVVAIDAGPVITLYEVRLAPGTKVNSINTIASDLARELKAPNIRIVPNTAGKSTVGIEVPNLKKEKVRLKDLMSLGGPGIFEKQRMPMFLGKDVSGEPLIADLAEMPHMLIAGTTGSGKSICINSIIMSFLFGRRPDELKLVLVDPKMVEMAQFRDVPHLMCPVVTEMGKAAAILEWAVTKMEERYALLAEAGVRDIDSYNELEWEELKEAFSPATEEEEAQIPKKLPRLVFVIDELADLILTHKEVEGHIVRIAQKARAVGIHLILATQRPQANVVTGLIKSNMPCRVSFKVASGMDSRIVLDSKGAELLLGQGDMLYLSPKTSELMRAQGTLVDDKEVRKVVRFLKNVAAPSFEPQLMQLKNPAADPESEAERDPLFEDAVRCVLQSKRGSVSLLQRRLTVGYGRAARLIEEMAEAGIIGEYKGTQSREVNLSLEEWDKLKAQAHAEAGFDPLPAEDQTGSHTGDAGDESAEAKPPWDDPEDEEDAAGSDAGYEAADDEEEEVYDEDEE